MRPSESVRNYTSTLRMYANFSARTVKKVCADTPARVAGSEEELKAQQFMAAQVGDAADEVTQEEFKVSPRAYLGWLRPAGIVLLILLMQGTELADYAVDNRGIHETRYLPNPTALKLLARMKSPGLMKPSSGWTQRTSASALFRRGGLH